MDEKEKQMEQPEKQSAAPEDYSRYMGTLNRIYRRNNNPKKHRLNDGIGSLKKGQQPAAAPEPGKKDKSFFVVAGGAIVLMAILYFIKLL